MIAIPKPQTIGPVIPRHTRVLLGERGGVRASYSLPARTALIENHNVVQSFSPGLPREAAATLGGTSQRPISPIPPRPKSTVDLQCEPLIKVENGFRPPIPQPVTNQQSGPKIKESNQNQTVTNRKILSLISAHGGYPQAPFCKTNPFLKIPNPLFINEKRKI
jgi:hypothetical protein